MGDRDGRADGAPIAADNIPQQPTNMPAQDSRRVRLAMARLWGNTVNKHGGNVSLAHLPEVGLRARISELNNVQIADVISKFLTEEGLHAGRMSSTSSDQHPAGADIGGAVMLRRELICPSQAPLAEGALAIPRPFPFRLNWNVALTLCFIAFSRRKPVSTLLENTLIPSSATTLSYRSNQSVRNLCFNSDYALVRGRPSG